MFDFSLSSGVLRIRYPHRVDCVVSGIQESAVISLDSGSGEIAQGAAERLPDPGAGFPFPPRLTDHLQYSILVHWSFLTYDVLDHTPQLAARFGLVYVETCPHKADRRRTVRNGPRLRGVEVDSFVVDSRCLHHEWVTDGFHRVPHDRGLDRISQARLLPCPVPVPRSSPDTVDAPVETFQYLLTES